MGVGAEARRQTCAHVADAASRAGSAASRIRCGWRRQGERRTSVLPLVDDQLEHAAALIPAMSEGVLDQREKRAWRGRQTVRSADDIKRQMYVAAERHEVHMRAAEPDLV